MDEEKKNLVQLFDKAMAKKPDFLDLNNNGIPDYKEPWLYKTLFKVGLFLARLLAPDHTMFRRGMEAVDAEAKRAGIF